jgi:hypothetical protein
MKGCVEFAEWGPDLLPPPGDPRHSFLLGKMWPHVLTKWHPLASRTAHLLSTQNAGIFGASGMSNAQRWLGAGPLSAIVVVAQLMATGQAMLDRSIHSLWGSLSARRCGEPVRLAT